jgi:hypothetical protein
MGCRYDQERVRSILQIPREKTGAGKLASRGDFTVVDYPASFPPGRADMLIRLDKRLLASGVAFEVPGGVLLIVTDPTGEQVADR